MQPTAMWLYTLTYCDTDKKNCGNNLIWGTRSITVKYLTAGDTYQFTVSTAKAVTDPVAVFSNIVTRKFPPPT